MIQPAGFPKLPPDFDYETEVHQSLDRKVTLFFNIFKRRGVEPKRALLIIHGQGEHGARYQHFAHYLHDQYDLIIAPDLRGHGRSEGLRGHVEQFDEYVDDAILGWDVLKKKTGSQCVRDWFGHSMGGLITLRAFLYREADAAHVILSAPCLKLGVAVPWVKRAAAHVLKRVWGTLQLDTGLNRNQLTHDPAVIEAHEKDLLNHHKATPQFYLSFLEAMETVRNSQVRFSADTEVLIQVAGEDQIVDPSAEKLFYEQLKHEKKKLIMYPGLYHELYNELNKEYVFEDLIQWLKAPTQNNNS